MTAPVHAHKIAAIIALLAALLGGCGNPAEQPNNSRQTHAGSAPGSELNLEQAAPKASAPSPEAPANRTGSTDNGTHASAAESPTVKPAPSDPVKEAPKLYAMNAAYRFEPIAGSHAEKKAVLLTFDDGPKDEATLTAMLDTLDKHHAKAIFFVNGYRVKAKPELLKLIASRGQTIGNHSWDHVDLKKEEEAAVRKQIGDVQRIVKEVTGQSPRFFRPPFGSGGDLVKKIAGESGLLFMTWSNGSLDWDSSTKDKPEKVIANVIEQLHPGANILMHELPWTKDALDSLLTQLKAKGYSFIDPSSIDPKPKSTNAK